ncbi:MAG: hypothetical protein IJX87_02380 [Clostridia bacterium]|nr:hypothetical protein [Clostridia bacterium]
MKHIKLIEKIKEKRKEKAKAKHVKQLWKSYCHEDYRPKMFQLVYSYLRLHKELLEDSIYQEMYDYHRETMIAYATKWFKDTFIVQEGRCGRWVDKWADSYKEDREDVEEVKPLVELLYKTWEKDGPREIRI